MIQQKGQPPTSPADKQQVPDQKQPKTVRKPKASLRFSPTAWAKLLFFRDRGETEIGGFGITPAEDLLYVEEFIAVRQDVTMVSVAFDDEAVADFFESQVAAGRKPEQFARIWLHTHPGDSPGPSSTDEETFQRVFGGCQWAVMFILGQSGKSYARMMLNVGPGAAVAVPADVDYRRAFGQSDPAAWEAEYKANIKAESTIGVFGSCTVDSGQGSAYGYCCPEDWLEELEAMEPAERRLVLDELSVRPDLWAESEVFDEY